MSQIYLVSNIIIRILWDIKGEKQPSYIFEYKKNDKDVIKFHNIVLYISCFT